MDQVTNTAVLPVGTPIIYYNHWTGFETEAFRKQFKQFTPEEIRKLKKGDVIYVDIDPLHPRGKVYGHIKALVTDVEYTSGSEIRIHYRGGSWIGFKTTHKGTCHAILTAVDEDALARLVAEYPASKSIDPRYDK
jgi:hypothetical protein